MTYPRTKDDLQGIRQRVLSTWPDITDGDIDEAEGSFERLVATIYHRTGESPETIRRTIDELREHNGGNGDDGDDDGDDGERSGPAS